MSAKKHAYEENLTQRIADVPNPKAHVKLHVCSNFDRDLLEQIRKIYIPNVLAEERLKLASKKSADGCKSWGEYTEMIDTNTGQITNGVKGGVKRTLGRGVCIYGCHTGGSRVDNGGVKQVSDIHKQRHSHNGVQSRGNHLHLNGNVRGKSPRSLIKAANDLKLYRKIILGGGGMLQYLVDEEQKGEGLSHRSNGDQRKTLKKHKGPPEIQVDSVDTDDPPQDPETHDQSKSDDKVDTIATVAGALTKDIAKVKKLKKERTPEYYAERARREHYANMSHDILFVEQMIDNLKIVQVAYPDINMSGVIGGLRTLGRRKTRCLNDAQVEGTCTEDAFDDLDNRTARLGETLGTVLKDDLVEEKIRKHRFCYRDKMLASTATFGKGKRLQDKLVTGKETLASSILKNRERRASVAAAAEVITSLPPNNHRLSLQDAIPDDDVIISEPPANDQRGDSDAEWDVEGDFLPQTLPQTRMIVKPIEIVPDTVAPKAESSSNVEGPNFLPRTLTQTRAIVKLMKVVAPKAKDPNLSPLTLTRIAANPESSSNVQDSNLNSTSKAPHTKKKGLITRADEPLRKHEAVGMSPYIYSFYLTQKQIAEETQKRWKQKRMAAQKAQRKSAKPSSRLNVGILQYGDKLIPNTSVNQTVPGESTSSVVTVRTYRTDSDSTDRSNDERLSGHATQNRTVAEKHVVQNGGLKSGGTKHTAVVTNGSTHMVKNGEQNYIIGDVVVHKHAFSNGGNSGKVNTSQTGLPDVELTDNAHLENKQSSKKNKKVHFGSAADGKSLSKTGEITNVQTVVHQSSVINGIKLKDNGLQKQNSAIKTVNVGNGDINDNDSGLESVISMASEISIGQSVV